MVRGPGAPGARIGGRLLWVIPSKGLAHSHRRACQPVRSVPYPFLCALRQAQRGHKMQTKPRTGTNNSSPTSQASWHRGTLSHGTMSFSFHANGTPCARPIAEAHCSEILRGSAKTIDEQAKGRSSGKGSVPHPAGIDSIPADPSHTRSPLFPSACARPSACLASPACSPARPTSSRFLFVSSHHDDG